MDEDRTGPDLEGIRHPMLPLILIATAWIGICLVMVGACASAARGDRSPGSPLATIGRGRLPRAEALHLVRDRSDELAGLRR